MWYTNNIVTLQNNVQSYINTKQHNKIQNYIITLQNNDKHHNTTEQDTKQHCNIKKQQYTITKQNY